MEFSCYDGAEDLVGETLFLNVLVENCSEGVQTIVRENVGKKLGRGIIAARIAKRAGQLAYVAISDNKVGERMSKQVCEALPSRLGEIGISAEVERVFLKGPFFVLKLTILDVDMRAVLAEKTGEEDNAFACVFDFLGKVMALCGRKATYENSINALIATKLQVILPERLGSVVESKGLTCAIGVKTKEEQAIYFFDIISNGEGFAMGASSSGGDNSKEVNAGNSEAKGALKEGILHKMSPSFGVGLQSRYFVLRQTSPKIVELMYFEKKEDYYSCGENLAAIANTRKGTIKCSEIQNIALDPYVIPNKFQILITMDSNSSHKTEYQLFSGSANDANAWITEIRKAIKDTM